MRGNSNFFIGIFKHRNALAMFFACLFICLPLKATAASSVCAVVKLQIQQELTLERQGFDAHMNITNGLDTITLQNVGVIVNFTDEQGNPVIATSDPNNTAASFFIRIDTMTGINAVDGTGTVAPASSADIHWFIVPAPGAAGSTPIPKLYFVGATLNYTLGGELKTVDVIPDSIYVKPTPRLILDYFIPSDVFADDPFTLVFEPPIPFNLGVRVSNNGYGSADNLKIDSAQPKIIENTQGLLINFELLGGSVNDAPVAPSLLLDFGTVDSYSAATGRWQMQTSLSGKFTAFTADFSHADALGGQLTSLIDGAFTHFLLRDVIVDLPGRDAVRDFLASDVSILPANGGVVRVYESSGGDSAVTNQTGSATLASVRQSGTDHIYTLTMPATAGFSFIHLADPFAGSKVIKQVTRSDGKPMPLDNVWLSKARKGTTGWNYFFNLFDANSTGSYTIVFAAAATALQPPVIRFVPDYQVQPGAQLGFLVEASSSKGGTPVLSTGLLPVGASFTDHGNGTATFSWTPVQGQEGQYTIDFNANDGALNATAQSTITVGTLNAAPISVNDSFTTSEDVSTSGNVLLNDSDANGDPLAASLVSNASNGSLSLAADGSFAYTPNFNFAGIDSFTYSVSDGVVDSNIAVVTITINALNDAPIVGIQAAGYALQFNGTSQVATMPDGLISTQNPVTIETWFNTTASGGLMGYATPVDPYGAVQSQPLIYVGVDGLLYASFAPSNLPLVSNVPVNNGQWHHVALVADTSGSKLYIDGVLMGSSTAAIAHTSYTVGQLGVVDNYGQPGGVSSGLAYFQGAIDELRIWNKARTAAEIQATMRQQLLGTETNLVGLWPFNDGAGGLSQNIVNNANGILLGNTQVNTAPTWVASSAPVYADSFVMFEDSYANLMIAASDAEADPLTTTVSQLPSGGKLYQTLDGVAPTLPIMAAGTVVTHPNGKLVYVPAANGNGIPYDSFMIDVSDPYSSTGLLVTVDVTAVQDVPLAVNDIATTNEEQAVSIDVVVNDTDVDGDALSVTSLTLPVNGLAVVDMYGMVSYTPNINFAGTDGFDYTISDGNGGVATASIAVTINPVNDAPTASAPALITDEDVAGSTQVTVVDPDLGDTHSYAVTTAASNGIATVSATGVVSYTPNLNYFGAESLSITVTDAGGLTATVAIPVTVNAVNDAPSSSTASIITDEDVSSAGVTPSVVDVDDTTHTYLIVTQASNGVASIVNNQLVYLSNLNFNGSDSFTFSATDAGGLSVIGTASVTVNAVNDAPTASASVLITDEDVAGTTQITVVDPDLGDTHSYAVTTAPANGTANVSTTGAVTYTPTANWNGSDSITVTVTDSAGTTGIVTIPVSVNAVNDAPTASAPALITDEDVAGTTQITVVDPDLGDTHSYAVTTAAANGIATVSAAGVVSYTPNLNYFGADSLSITVTDTGGLTATVAIPVTVNAVNDAPSSTTASITTDEDVSSVGVTPSVVDVDDTTHTYLIVTQASNGVASIVNNQLVYLSNLNFNGSDSFTFRATDAGGLSVIGTASVIVNEVNDAPTASAPALITDEDVAGSTQITVIDPDLGDTHSYAVTTAAANGIATVSATGVVSYTPNLNYFGADSLSITATDTGGLTARVAIPVTVNAVNDAPSSSIARITTDEDVSSVGVTPSVVDVDDTMHTYLIVTQAGNGVASIVNNQLVYLSNLNFNGSDSFTFSATDAGGLSVIGTASVTVNAVNDAPVSVADTFVTDEDLGLAGSTVLVNDIDVDGDALTAVLVSTPTNGSVTFNADGTFSYAPNLNWNGVDTFTYKANDGFLDSNISTVSITVNAVNDAPTASTPALITDEDLAGSAQITVTDPDLGDTHSYAVTTAPANGAASVNATGAVTYTPNLNYFGADSLSITVTDTGGLTAIVAIPVTVNAVNDAPSSSIASITTDEDISSIGVTPSVVDVDDTRHTYLIVTQASNGVASIVNNQLVYLSNLNFNGSDSFTFRATDAGGLSVIGTASVIVNAVNDAPIADAGADQLVFVDDVVTLNGMASYDIDGDPLTYVWRVAKAPNGSQSLFSSSTSAMTWFTPDEQGDYLFELIVNDGLLDSVADTVALHVPNRVPVAMITADPYAYIDDAVVLDGSASYDLDHDPLSYHWSLIKPSGSISALTDPYAVSPTFVIDQKGDYIVILVVNDGIEPSVAVSAMIHIPNRAPVADAGLDQTVYICDLATVNGNASYDLDHDPITYDWSLSTPQGSRIGLTSTKNSTTSFVPDLTGQYQAQLTVHDGTIVSTPDTSVITAVNPPVNVNSNIHYGSAARILVLLQARDDESSDHENLVRSTVAQSWLEAVLSSKGWLYTIVYDEESFVRELHTGGYTVYGVLGGEVSESTQVELTAAVYRGEGLIYASAKEVHGLSEVLGVETSNYHSKVWQMQLQTSELAELATINFINGTDVSPADLKGATSIAGAQIIGEYDNEVSVYRTIGAVNTFADGKAVYFGFDIFNEIDSGLHNGLLASVLDHSLDYVKPAQVTPAMGAVVPVIIDVSNMICVPSSGQITLRLPQGATVIESGLGTLDSNGLLVWAFDLLGNANSSWTVWVRLPSQPGSFNLEAAISAGYSGFNFQPFGTVLFNIDTTDFSVNFQLNKAIDAAIDDRLKQSLVAINEHWLDGNYKEVFNKIVKDESESSEPIQLLLSWVLRSVSMLFSEESHSEEKSRVKFPQNAGY